MKKSGATKAKKVKRYQAYLRSKVWKEKRAACLERAGHRCEMTIPAGALLLDVPGIRLTQGTDWRCHETEKLTAHHLTYARFGGDEIPEDLQCLCRYHHDYVSALEGRRIA